MGECARPQARAAAFRSAMPSDRLTPQLRQHRNFLASAQLRDFTLSHVSDMTEHECFLYFKNMRFGASEEFPCPWCGTAEKHNYRPDRRRWQCESCDHSFSVTTNTALQDRKLPFRKLLMVLAIFVSGAKGISAHQLARQVNVQVKTAYVLCGKMREALTKSADTSTMSGQVEIDGGHFGGRPRSGRVRRKASQREIAEKVNSQLSKTTGTEKANPRKGRTAANYKRLQKRRIVIAIRLHSGTRGMGACRSVIAVVPAEKAEHVMPVIERYVEPGSTIWTDENSSYIQLSARYQHDSVNHQIEYSTIDGVNENQSESYYSRLRRYFIGVSHKCEPKYLENVAWEMAWREDVRRITEGEKTKSICSALLSYGISIVWRGYWQRNRIGRKGTPANI